MASRLPAHGWRSWPGRSRTPAIRGNRNEIRCWARPGPTPRAASGSISRGSRPIAILGSGRRGNGVGTRRQGPRLGPREQDQTITLEPERVVRGRIIDLQGQPIAGVSVRVSRYETLPYDADGEALPWPGPATTDEQGRFTVRGLGLGATMMLEASSDRHARQTLRIDPRDEAKTGELTLALSPAQVIEVRVTHADDGKPVAGAWVNVLSLSDDRSQLRRKKPMLAPTSKASRGSSLRSATPSGSPPVRQPASLI